MNLLAGPQKTGADHIHPTFNREGTKIEIQSALISKDNRSLNICIVPVPKTFLNRTYSIKATDALGRGLLGAAGDQEEIGRPPGRRAGAQ